MGEIPRDDFEKRIKEYFLSNLPKEFKNKIIGDEDIKNGLSEKNIVEEINDQFSIIGDNEQIKINSQASIASDFKKSVSKNKDNQGQNKKQAILIRENFS